MEEVVNYGALCLIPVLIVIIMAVITKRAAESLLVGTLVAAVLVAKGGFFWTWLEFLSNEMLDSTYYILLFGLFGSMIKVLERSGSALGFSEIGTKLAKSRGVSLIVTWALGIIIFIDDYLNALGVGVAMRNITDRYRVSREFLAYVVNSTGAAVCVLIPVSSWAAVMSGQLADINPVEGMTGLQVYMSSIPFMIYAWAAVIAAPLFALGVIPLFGPMKKAELRARETGVTLPPSASGSESESIGDTDIKPSSFLNFLLPMLVLAAITIWKGDILLGLLAGYGLLVVMCLAQRLIGFGKIIDYTIDGFKDMLYVTMLVIIAFVLQDFNDVLGLAQYVINGVVPVMTPVAGLFPAVIFFVVGLLAFATGSFWGVAAICFPIAIPLAQALDSNIFLTTGAVVAATAFGSHACFYSDAVTVTVAATGLKNIDYAKTAIPLIAVPFAVAIVFYLILGFTIG